MIIASITTIHVRGEQPNARMVLAFPRGSSTPKEEVDMADVNPPD